MMSSHRIPVTDESATGQVRRFISGLCREAGMDETMAGQATIVGSEMAHNLVRHGSGGEMVVWQSQDAAHPVLELLALDQGKGMADVAACLRDGHSTSGTMGTGLGSIRRLSSQFDIYSEPGHGTAVWSRMFGPPAALHGGFEYGGVSVPVAGEVLCGDAWHLKPHAAGARLQVIVVDGLGHGPSAEAAASEAVSTFQNRKNELSPAEMLEEVHRALTKTRGAAGSVVEIDPAGLKATGAGVGNVMMRLWSNQGSKALVSDNGTLGGNVRKVQQFTQPWSAESLLIMHSDGLSTQWNLGDYPGLPFRHPSLVAGVLYRDFRRQRDDATVVVVRYRP